MASEAYLEYIDDIGNYFDDKISSAINNNPELKNISRIPIIGNVVTNNLEKTVNDMVGHVLDESLQDLASPENKAVIDDIAHLILDTFIKEEGANGLDGLVNEIILDSLELVKDQVKIQQWKIRDELLHEDKLESEESVISEDLDGVN